MQFTIDTVAQLTGLSKLTLRNWEKRYAFLAPRRSDNGFRAYDEADVQLLGVIAAQLARGARIGDLAARLAEGEVLPDPRGEVPEAVAREADALYGALLDYESDRAAFLYQALAARLAPHELVDQVFHPLFERMGYDWERGEATVAQEHFVSAFLRLRLAPLLTVPPAPRGKTPSALLATAGSAQHEGGLLLLGAQLALRQWRTFYFGTQLPLEDLEQAVARLAPDVACLSFATADEARVWLPKLGRLRARVCVGGRGVALLGPAERSPANVHVIRSRGRTAVSMVEIVAAGTEPAPSARGA